MVNCRWGKEFPLFVKKCLFRKGFNRQLDYSLCYVQDNIDKRMDKFTNLRMTITDI